MRRFGNFALYFGSALAVAGIFALLVDRRRRMMNGLGLDPRVNPGRKRGLKMLGKTRGADKTLTHYYHRTMPIEQRVSVLQDLVWKGVQNPEMRKLALAITGCGTRTVKMGGQTHTVRGACCPERDGKCEARAVYDYVKKNVRYTGDVAPVRMGSRGEVEGIDLFQAPSRTVEIGGGDCLPAETLLLTDKHEFVRIDQIQPGTKIWGRDNWTEVKDVWHKGTLPVDAVFLNNGSMFRATGEHKVYVALCPRHPVKSKCWCPISERSVERVLVGKLEPGMVMIQPDVIAAGNEEQDPKLAYMDGLFLSDGWCSHEASFDIAGKDGHPKESQKKEVKEICDQLGVSTYWHEKYIRVKDKAWTSRMHRMGGRAPEKHALSINLRSDAAQELLRGILADSGKNTHGGGRTFTTTSRQLMLQTRMLLKMAGVSCSERYITNHGGLGKNPIHRLGIRDMERSDGKNIKLLRVKDIERNVEECPVFDITTADHYVYLPEADVTVSNCDDHSVLAATLLSLNGITANFRVTKPSKFGSDFSHIYPLALLPKGLDERALALDTTVPGEFFGREASYGGKKDFPA